ncbi:MAG: hypothetical protein JWM10_2108 [Myxococcaceae bacterium]|nr:hypothetical protein [Myxococcaceae bacterium]
MQSSPYREAPLVPPTHGAAWRAWPWGHTVAALVLPLAEAVYAQREPEYLILPFALGAALGLLFWALPHHGDLVIHEESSAARAHARASLLWAASVVATAAVFVILRGVCARHEHDAAAAVSRAVECFRDERGEYPPSLDALVPRYLPRVPRPYRMEGDDCLFLYERVARGAILGRLDYVPGFGCGMNHGVVYDFARRSWVECDGLRCPVPPR